MSSTRPAEADSDARYRGWTERIQRIKTETYYLFWNRRLFRAVQHMFQTNEALQKAGGDWLAPFRLAWALPTSTFRTTNSIHDAKDVESYPVHNKPLQRRR